ncbi:hypothetical protein Misp03_12990 [Microbispora sp. NBRC 16548]|nr:hypothetical protein Misp03_12990 [Microbispora sp. NBRC 16548]
MIPGAPVVFPAIADAANRRSTRAQIRGGPANPEESSRTNGGTKARDSAKLAFPRIRAEDRNLY